MLVFWFIRNDVHVAHAYGAKVDFALKQKPNKFTTIMELGIIIVARYEREWVWLRARTHIRSNVCIYRVDLLGVYIFYALNI